MSTLIDSNAPKPKSSIARWLWLIPVIVLGGVVFLAILYYGIGFFFTRQIDTLYTERDCVSVTNSAEYVEKFYPLKIAPFTDPSRAQAVECREYLKADALYEKKNWEAAYVAYTAYQAAYPKGIYATDALNLAANSLYKLALEQRNQHNYSKAVDNLSMLLNKYKSAPIRQQAKGILPEVYLEWGAECRLKSEFAEAETVYKSLNIWASQEEEQAHVRRARTELAQTYFDWGKELQASRDFSEASRKFELAISTDPNPSSTNGPAAQTRTHLPSFQQTWGIYLISQGKYAEAIAHFKTSITLSSPGDVENAKDTLAQAYLAWADTLQKGEDYTQALEKINDAREAAATDGYRTDAEDAHAATLDLFSKSKGTQAKKIISDVSMSICKSGKPLETLPIIGISDTKQLVVSGTQLSLPGNVLAQSPGNLHFVACSEEKETTLQNCPFSRTGYGIATHWIKRIRYEWQIKVYNSQTGKLVNQKTFQGSAPSYCPQRYSFGFSSTVYFRGDKPITSTVTDWLASLLK